MTVPSTTLIASTISLLLCGLIGCGGNDTGESTGASDTTQERAAATTTAAGDTATVTIRPVGNTITYATEKFTVAAGQTVRLVFENVATSPAMHHNVTLLRTPDAIERVASKALDAEDHLPEDPAILALTPMSAPGETVEVTFTAPSAPGDYPYICTFPGHYRTMQGTMHVTG